MRFFSYWIFLTFCLCSCGSPEVAYLEEKIIEDALDDIIEAGGHRDHHPQPKEK